MAQIRKAKPDDAARLIELFQQLDQETNFMLFEPGERAVTLDEQVNRLRKFESSPTETMFIAEDSRAILGFAVGVCGAAKRNSRTANAIVGVLQNYWRQGLGRALLGSIEVWAKAGNVHRLELTVMAHNTGAIALYEKCGFEREGLRRDALYVDGKYVSEIYMSKLI